MLQRYSNNGSISRRRKGNNHPHPVPRVLVVLDHQMPRQTITLLEMAWALLDQNSSARPQPSKNRNLPIHLIRMEYIIPRDTPDSEIAEKLQQCRHATDRRVIFITMDDDFQLEAVLSGQAKRTVQQFLCRRMDVVAIKRCQSWEKSYQERCWDLYKYFMVAGLQAIKMPQEIINIIKSTPDSFQHHWLQRTYMMRDPKNRSLSEDKYEDLISIDHQICTLGLSTIIQDLRNCPESGIYVALNVKNPFSMESYDIWGLPVFNAKQVALPRSPRVNQLLHQL